MPRNEQWKIKVTETKQDIVSVAVTPFDHMVAAGERALLNMGIPIPFLARILMQHAASLVALVEPPAIRHEILKELVSNFPAAVRRAQLASATTTGGIILPHARADALEEVPGA